MGTMLQMPSHDGDANRKRNHRWCTTYTVLFGITWLILLNFGLKSPRATYFVTELGSDSETTTRALIDLAKSPEAMGDMQEQERAHQKTAEELQGITSDVEGNRSSSMESLREIAPATMEQEKQPEKKEEPRQLPDIAFITVADPTNTSEFEDFVLPSINTWFKSVNSSGPCIDSLHVLMSDTDSARSAYEELRSKHESAFLKIDDAWGGWCPTPTDDGTLHRGESAACAFQKGMLTVLERNPECDWYLFGPPNQYVRTERLRRRLSDLDPTQAVLVTSNRTIEMLPMSVPPSVEIHDDDVFRYPTGLPIIYSRAAVQRLAGGWEKNSVVKQTLEFQESFVVGLQIVHWMYSLPVMLLPDLHSEDPQMDGVTGLTALTIAVEGGESSQVNSLGNGNGLMLMWDVHRFHTKFTGVPSEVPLRHDPVWHNITALKVRNQSRSDRIFHSIGTEEEEWPTLKRSELESLAGIPPSPTTGRPNVAFITYAHLEDTSRFDNIIFPSLDTWHEAGVYFVVLNSIWTNEYDDLCRMNSPRCERIEVFWVNCTEDYYGESPCCKEQDGMIEVFSRYPDFDWYIYQDDDMYMRASYIEEFLSGVDVDDPAIACPSLLKTLGTSVFDDCEYNCTDSLPFLYPWCQPVMYNRGAMKDLVKAFEMKALVKQCEAFGVTHDVGNSLVHWMLSIPVLRLGIAFVYYMDIPGTPVEDPDYALGIHGIGQEDNPSFREVHAHYRKATEPRPFRYSWHNVTGFYETKTFQTYGDPRNWDTWHTMPTEHCLVDN